MRSGIRRPPTGHGMNMDPLLRTIAEIVYVALDLYVWVLIISAILSWLIAFNVVNTRNRAVYMISDVLYRLTEPALRPIRNVLPNLGGVDLSPVVLILIVMFVQRLILNYGMIG
jgi:YggT family protein